MTDCEKQTYQMQIDKALEALKDVQGFLSERGVPQSFGLGLKVQNTINMLEA
jgi:hypothetical protein